MGKATCFYTRIQKDDDGLNIDNKIVRFSENE